MSQCQLEKRRELLGEDHPDTLSAMGNSAVTYYELGQFMQAEELCAGALKKYRELLGDEHWNTIWIMRNLALTYRKLDKVPEAEELERLVAYHDV
jgi:tetratricopeptide (TPR) repeat protein